MYEVEQKYRLTDPVAFAQALAEGNVEWTRETREEDTYFRHPTRDFRQTDEALRVRLQAVRALSKSEVPEPMECLTGNGFPFPTGDEWAVRAFITYKGPKLRRSSKTREELELPLVTDAERLPQWKALLQVLGFQPVTPVRKVRRKAWLEWQGARVEISRDWVQNIGEFAELEIVVKEQEEIPEAEQKILVLAQKLHLGDVEMKSYLELVLEDSHAALT